jgi:hypothetical protein
MELQDRVVPTVNVLNILLLCGLWVVWWLFGANWRKLWPVLAEGAWAPVLLLMFMATEVWSRVDPKPCDCLVFVVLPNFWWQLGAVTALVLVALICGWLQGLMGCTPPEYPVNPAPAVHGHDHGLHHAHVNHEHTADHGHEHH